jgi:hypothetical protein
MPSLYRVALVVDRHFGQRLNALAARLHVWVCETPVNRQAAEEIWRAHPCFPDSAGVTVFQVEDEESAEDMLIRVLGEIELHHGEYSHDPPWSILEVYGTGPTPVAEAALHEYSVNRLEATDQGFIAYRKIDHNA